MPFGPNSPAVIRLIAGERGQKERLRARTTHMTPDYTEGQTVHVLDGGFPNKEYQAVVARNAYPDED